MSVPQISDTKELDVGGKIALRADDDIIASIRRFRDLGILPRLLEDRTTGRNIVWATDSYAVIGPEFGRKAEIKPEFLIERGRELLRIRAEKRAERSRQRGEVFTPLFIVEKMCDYARKSLRHKDWRNCVRATVLEIACGEAPFLASRREGGEIVPIERRVGILDRKIALADEKAGSKEEWLEWAGKAYMAAYGYEFQGDNLLLARINLLRTFEERLRARWNAEPSGEEYERTLKIIVRNIWQMDGLTGTIPFEKAKRNSALPLFGSCADQGSPPCAFHDWNRQKDFIFNDLGSMEGNAMKFDFVIGNPPYQEETGGTSDRPVYNYFMDSAYKVAEKVMLITPARFLFNAGKTPKEWNRKMLDDEHLKVILFKQDSSEFFAGTDIKGGVAITYRDSAKIYGSIKNFIPNTTLKIILNKVLNIMKGESFYVMVKPTEYYRLSQALHDENKFAKDNMSAGHEFDLTSNLLDKNKDLFSDNQMNNCLYVRVIGRQGGKRAKKYLKRSYIESCEGIDKFKVIIPESNNNGSFGETLADPFIGKPGDITTQTFLSIGFFDTEQEAEFVKKYISTKFARALLGTLKITQHNKRNTWKNVPLQDFTSSSDIDWSKSIAEIDRQLYKKYGLDESEIEFIETNVREMP